MKMTMMSKGRGQGSARFLLPFLAALALTLVLAPVPLWAEPREWTDTAGNTVKADYVKCGDDSVTLRLPNLKLLEVPLDKLSEADREHVQKLREEEKEANQLKVKLKGEIIWRLDNRYRSMSLSTAQNAEIWTWNEEEKEAREKVTTVKVTYNFNFDHARNEITGSFETDEPVAFPKDEKLVIVAILRLQKDNKPIEARDTSVPMAVPEDSFGTVKLPTARASAR